MCCAPGTGVAVLRLYHRHAFFWAKICLSYRPASSKGGGKRLAIMIDHRPECYRETSSSSVGDDNKSIKLEVYV